MTARIALASLFVVAAAMAYPWRSTADRWLLGVAIVVVLVLFVRWQGSFMTTIVGRRITMWGRRNRAIAAHHSSLLTTVLLQVDGSRDLPLSLIAGYLDRYGIRCDKIRITSRDFGGVRTRWISLTVGAVDNLAALRARSPRIPLRDIAEVVGRRLANHLRELGWTVAVVDDADTPVQSDAKETWHGLRDESGYVTAYRVGTKNGFDEVLAIPSADTWTVLEISGTRTKLRTAAACAIRTTGKPVTIAGAKPLNGRHRLALDALSPLSAQRLEALTGT